MGFITQSDGGSDMMSVIEEVSLQSYLNWPVIFLRPLEMVGAGFYYTGLGDRVRCAVCGIEVELWEEGDDPLEIHQLYNDRCWFAQWTFGMDMSESSGSEASSISSSDGMSDDEETLDEEEEPFGVNRETPDTQRSYYNSSEESSAVNEETLGGTRDIYGRDEWIVSGSHGQPDGQMFISPPPWSLHPWEGRLPYGSIDVSPMDALAGGRAFTYNPLGSSATPEFDQMVPLSHSTPLLTEHIGPGTNMGSGEGTRTRVLRPIAVRAPFFHNPNWITPTANVSWENPGLVEEDSLSNGSIGMVEEPEVITLE